MEITTDIRLLRHVVTTVLLASTAVVVAWQVFFTAPDMGVNRYTGGRVFSTGNGGTAVQTRPVPKARVVSIQQDPLPSGVPHAK